MPDDVRCVQTGKDYVYLALGGSAGRADWAAEAIPAGWRSTEA
jgi:hypothetical protein